MSASWGIGTLPGGRCTPFEVWDVASGGAVNRVNSPGSTALFAGPGPVGETSGLFDAIGELISLVNSPTSPVGGATLGGSCLEGLAVWTNLVNSPGSLVGELCACPAPEEAGEALARGAGLDAVEESGLVTV